MDTTLSEALVLRIKSIFEYRVISDARPHCLLICQRKQYLCYLDYLVTLHICDHFHHPRSYEILRCLTRIL